MSSLGAVALLSTAHAQTAPAPVNLDLGSVLATGSSGSIDYVQTPGTAPYEAPSKAPLNSVQPTSVVSQQTIQQQLIGAQGYVDAATLTPSVSAIQPNGPGLMEAQGMSIRGLQDGQFNVTFDGIPIGDSNDFTHHSTSFFMANDMGQLIVDRGPGTAETVGDATFGGTVSLRTKDPLATPTLTPYGEYGSYNTSLEGLEYDTGAIRTANGTAGIFDIEHEKSDGALTGANQERTNLFSKVEIPVNPNTMLTLLAQYNKIYQVAPIGSTGDQIQALGSNYSYNSDQNSQAYNRFNDDHITTDMEYADLRSNLAPGWQYDGKLYTYGYYHYGINGADVNGKGLPGQYTNDEIIAMGDVPNLVTLTPNGTPVSGVPGQNMLMNYRSYGTIQRLQRNFDLAGMPSDVKFGLWYDHQYNTRSQVEVSLSNGNVPNYYFGPQYIDRLMHDQLTSLQPYVQFDIHPVPKLELTAGVKYAYFNRNLDAQVNQKTGLPLSYTKTFTHALPSFVARYHFEPNLSAYAQVAEGFLAPNLNTFYVQNPDQNSFAPEQTWNYQTGFAYQSRHLAIGGDVYLIHFLNYVTSAGSGVNKHYINEGGVIYKGIEGEATYTFNAGVSLFANGGLNYANQTGSNNYLSQVPQYTANFGVIYNKHGIYGSLIDQMVGGEYDGNGGAANPRAPGAWYDPYSLLNAVVGYTFQNPLGSVHGLRVKLNFFNITNQKQIFMSPGQTAANNPTDLYWTLPGVSVFASVSIPIGM